MNVDVTYKGGWSTTPDYFVPPFDGGRIDATLFGQRAHPMDVLVSAMTRLCVEVGLLERELEATR